MILAMGFFFLKNIFHQNFFWLERMRFLKETKSYVKLVRGGIYVLLNLKNKFYNTFYANI